MFKSDGCTCFPSGNWIACCVEHDYTYADGGNLIDKIKADCRLARCVWKQGYIRPWWQAIVNFICAPVMFIGVSIFGFFGHWRWK